MYLEHFGLSKVPFQAVAQGDRVYVGPRQARALANLRIALAVPDAMVTVTGPVGVGKTTLVNRVLDLVAAKRAVARVGRTPLTGEELLEHLLAEFSISGTGSGRIERLRTLRQFFKDCGATGLRAFVLVEDARALNEALLGELESVTAADPDGSPGANVILMGSANINALIDSPELEHVRQRTRLRQELQPLNVEEMAGYVRHQLESAGGRFETIVDPRTPKVLRHCTGGIPRIVNNLCETALTVAATGKMPNLLPQLVHRVAVTIYGIAARGEDAADSGLEETPEMLAPAPPEASRPAPQAAAGPALGAEPGHPTPDEQLAATIWDDQPAEVPSDPVPTIVEEDLPEEMVEAAEALAELDTPHPAEVTQDLRDLPGSPAADQAEEFAAAEPQAPGDAATQDDFAQRSGAAPGPDPVDMPQSRVTPTAAAAPPSEADPAEAEPSVLLAPEATFEPDMVLETVADPEPATPEENDAWATPEIPSVAEAADEDLLNELSGYFPALEDAPQDFSESARIATLTVLDELSEDAADAEEEETEADLEARVQETEGERPRSDNIDWSTWPLASDSDASAGQLSVEPEPPPQTPEPPAPAITISAEPEPVVKSVLAKPEPTLEPVIPAAHPPARPAEPPAPPRSEAQPAAAPPARPAEPPTLTEVQQTPPQGPAAPAAQTQPSVAADPPAPPMLTEVFQVTPRHEQPASPPDPQPIATPKPGPAPAVTAPSAAQASATTPPAPATPPPAADLDFSSLAPANKTAEAAEYTGDEDIPVIVDPPAPQPVEPELTDLAAKVSRVANLEDLDDLLAETLFGNAELEQLSTELKTKEGSAPVAPAQPAAPAPPAPGAAAAAAPHSAAAPAKRSAPPTGNPDDIDLTKAERMAILAAMNGLGKDDDEDTTNPRNALG